MRRKRCKDSLGAAVNISSWGNEIQRDSFVGGVLRKVGTRLLEVE